MNLYFNEAYRDWCFAFDRDPHSPQNMRRYLEFLNSHVPEPEATEAYPD